MKRWTQLTFALVTAVTLVACGGNDRANADRDNAPAVGTAGTANNAPDRDFVQEQLADGNAEVELGRLAQEKATRPEVREFGQMMVRDHTQAGEELRQIASKHNIQPAEADTGDHKDLHEKLTKATGAEFDREYIDAMVDDHEKAVNDVQEKAEDSDDPDVKQWAAKTLPTLKQHLERAKQIKENLGR